MEYRLLCDHYYSVTTYSYALQEAYSLLKLDLEKSDEIYRMYRSHGYKSSLETTTRFITYLELFVGMRWCIRELLGYKKEVGLLEDASVKIDLAALEDGLPLIDTIWWTLRNEMHHSLIPKLRPTETARLSGDMSKPIRANYGFNAPQPRTYPNWINPEAIKKYFLGEAMRTFSDSLSEHYSAISPLSEFAQAKLLEKSERDFGKGIEFAI